VHFGLQFVSDARRCASEPLRSTWQPNHMRRQPDKEPNENSRQDILPAAKVQYMIDN